MRHIHRMFVQYDMAGTLLCLYMLFWGMVIYSMYRHGSHWQATYILSFRYEHVLVITVKVASVILNQSCPPLYIF